MRAVFGPVFLGALIGLGAMWALQATDRFKPPTNTRLETVPCWFETQSDWPASECFFMHVPERHDQRNTRTIKFPVVRFKAPGWFSTKSPVLHLGAGGPGAPMYLDSSESMHGFWFFHDEPSLRQGRDLFVMDPRGAGLSEPLLTCQTYVDNVPSRWSRALTRNQAWQEIDQDYFECIDQFRRQGVDFQAYNSKAVAEDVELLRQALDVDQWVLVGVSHAATYAQLIVREFPDTVESMVLDSATFPSLKGHHNYKQNTLAPFRALFAYCDVVAQCQQPIADLPNRLWALYEKLQANAIAMQVSVPFSSEELTIQLTGERFVAGLMEGIYGTAIFEDLPKIIAELEYGHVFTIRKYLEDHLGYLLDDTYGDVSASAHYCYEVKPFTDFEAMRKMAAELPDGYIKDAALYTLNWPDYCDILWIEPGEPIEAMPVSTDVPTLFLHGSLDTVTPLVDVKSQRRHFPNSHIFTFEQSHSVMSSERCAEEVAAKFVRTPHAQSMDLVCGQ